MFSNADLDAAVEAGALSSDAALAFRRFVAARQASSLVDEEQFRLLTGFNDIFVAIAGSILLVALGMLGQILCQQIGLVPSRGPEGAAPLGGLLVAGAAWALAEYFTRVRRMALPSILFLLAFAGGVLWMLTSIAALLFPEADDVRSPALFGACALLTALATLAHWRRFGVPITIAALAAALSGAVIALAIAFVPLLADAPYWPMLACGIIVFLFAMRWDMSDRERRTRRADVAFWLHLLAAPLIAHALFHLLGAFDDRMSTANGLVVVLLYMAFGVVALAIDRRALLVSSLAYVLWALQMLLQHVGGLQVGMALTALVIGSALLLLSAFWHAARALVVARLPHALAERLPPVHEPAARAGLMA